MDRASAYLNARSFRSALGVGNLQPHRVPDEQWLVYFAGHDLMQRRNYASMEAMAQAAREHDHEITKARKLIARYSAQSSVRRSNRASSEIRHTLDAAPSEVFAQWRGDVGVLRGGTVKKLVGVFEPSEIEVLKEVFDSIWLHLERVGRVHGDDNNVRNWVSAQVIACARNGDVLDFNGLKTNVLKTLHQ